MGRVEFGALKDGEHFVPFISITFKVKSGEEHKMSFVADKKTKDIEQARSLIVECHNILSGKYGVNDFTYNKEGAPSE